MVAQGLYVRPMHTYCSGCTGSVMFLVTTVEVLAASLRVLAVMGEMQITSKKTPVKRLCVQIPLSKNLQRFSRKIFFKVLCVFDLSFVILLIC